MVEWRTPENEYATTVGKLPSYSDAAGTAAQARIKLGRPVIVVNVQHRNWTFVQCGESK